MAIATTSQFWNYRLNGEDPTAPVGTNNGTWTASNSDGSSADDYWVVTNSQYHVQPNLRLTMFFSRSITEQKKLK